MNGKKNQTSAGLYTARDRRRAANVIAVAAAAAASQRLLFLSPEAAARAIIARDRSSRRVHRPQPPQSSRSQYRVFLLAARLRQGRPPESAYALLPSSRNPTRRCCAHRPGAYSETVFRAIESAALGHNHSVGRRGNRGTSRVVTII